MMKVNGKFCFQQVILLTLIMIPGYILGISRIHDPIVITGRQLPEFAGHNVDGICVYRYINSTQTWEPVLYQIDELDGSGVYFGEKDGLLGDDDELVFLAGDLGDQAPESDWPDDIAARHWSRYEMKISDPLESGNPGYAYIFMSSTINRLDGRFFNINIDEDWIKTPTYTVWHAGHGFQAGLFMHKAAGGDSVNIVERQKFRIIGRISGINEEIAILEEMDGPIKILNGLASIDAFVGPKSIRYIAGGIVRQHRYLELEYRFKGSGGLPGMSFNVDQKGTYQFRTTFYPTFAEWQSGGLEIQEISNINIREVRITTDLRENAWGMQFFNPYNFDPPLRIDKTGNNYNATLPWPGNSWSLIVANPQDPDRRVNHASLLTVTKIPTVPSNSTGQFYFKDSQTKVKNDTGDEKSWGDTGFQMTGADLTGSIDFYTATYYLPENLTYQQGENLASRHLNPLQTEVFPQQLTFPVAVEIDPPGSGQVSRSPDITDFPVYSSVTLTAVPGPGYDFAGWSGDIESTVNPLTFTIDAPAALTARFEPRMHEIRILSSPQGLAFSVDGELQITPASLLWQRSTEHTIAADSIVELNDDQRYAFIKWDRDYSRAFQWKVTGDRIFTARYRTQYRLTAGPEIPAQGSVSKSPADGWVDAGMNAAVLAIPALYYRFSHWSGDTTGTQPAMILPLNSPRTLTAHFINDPPIIVTADTSFAEDDTLILGAEDLARWISDENTPFASLTFEFTSSDHILAEYETANSVLRLFPSPDWYGQDTLWVTVSDPVGASTRAPMLITVFPQPDAPKPFALLIPENGAGISEWPYTLEFFWEEAFDPDPADTVTYIFEIDSSSGFQSPVKITIDNIQWQQYILLWPQNLGDDTYYWRVTAKDKTGRTTLCRQVFSLSLTTDVMRSTDAIPSDYVLEQNYPNPFNSMTTFRYGLPHDEEVTVTLLNSFGQQVKTLWKGPQQAGYHSMSWHGRDDRGTAVSSGVYMILFKAKNHQIVKKILFLQ